MALTKTARTLVAAGTTQTAGLTNFQRGILDMTAVQGTSTLTLKITNGATGPTTQCTGRVLIAHNATLPAAASEGADWKTLYPPVGPGTANSASLVSAYRIDPSVMCLEVEFTGNTGQDVTVEAYLSEFTTVA